MRTPKTDSVAFDVLDANDFYPQGYIRHNGGAYVDCDFARALETELRNALTWMETYHRSFGEPATGPLAQDIARIKELLK